jgi:5'-3' exonuclease
MSISHFSLPPNQCFQIPNYITSSNQMSIYNIINNTPINPLAIPNHEISINQMAKLDKSKPVILVDTSYWLYYRYFALRSWYNKAFPEQCVLPNFNAEHKWLDNNIFMNKYRKLFIENLKSICRKNKTIVSNIVFCIDCSYKDIWRNMYTNEYKATRPESLKKKQFNSFDVFSYMKKDYLPELQVKYGVKILYNARCEADDVIGQMAPFLVGVGVPKVIIIANDNDYLQICNSQIIMSKGVIADDNNTQECDGERMLLKKILIGDISDNIKGCSINQKILDTNVMINGNSFKNIGKVNLAIIMDNPDKYNIFLELQRAIHRGEITSKDDDRLSNIRNFYENCILMDFQMIPIELKRELECKFKNLV